MKRFLSFFFLFLLLTPGSPLRAQTSITSNDGGETAAGNLYQAVTYINGLPGGGAVTLDISGSNTVTLGQPLPTLTQSVTFLGTSAVDQALNITASTAAEGDWTFDQTFSIGNAVTFSFLNSGSVTGSGTVTLFGDAVTANALSLGVSDNLLVGNIGFNNPTGQSASDNITIENNLLTGNSLSLGNNSTADIFSGYVQNAWTGTTLGSPPATITGNIALGAAFLNEGAVTLGNSCSLILEGGGYSTASGCLLNGNIAGGGGSVSLGSLSMGVTSQFILRGGGSSNSDSGINGSITGAAVSLSAASATLGDQSGIFVSGFLVNNQPNGTLTGSAQAGNAWVSLGSLSLAVSALYGESGGDVDDANNVSIGGSATAGNAWVTVGSLSLGNNANFGENGGNVFNDEANYLEGGVTGGNAKFNAGSVTMGNETFLGVEGGGTYNLMVGTLAFGFTTGSAAVSLGSLLVGTGGEIMVTGGTANNENSIVVENQATTVGGAAFTAASATLGDGSTLVVGGGVVLNENLEDLLVNATAGMAGVTLGSLELGNGATVLVSGGYLDNTGAEYIDATTAGGGASLTAGQVVLSNGSNLSVSGGAVSNVSVYFLEDPSTGGNAWVSLGSLGLGNGATFTAAGGEVDNAGATLVETSVTAGSAQFTAGSVTLLGGSALEVLGGAVNDAGVSHMTGTATAGNASVSLGSLAGSGAVSVWGAMATMQVDSGYFTGAISGDTSLEVSGPGTLVLDGPNAYTGNTSVLGGMLMVGDSPAAGGLVPTNTSVSAGATLAGCGMVQGAVANNGVVMPGNGGGGMLTVGNYTQAAGATLALGVSPSQSTMLNVAGTANLAGNLLVAGSGSFGVKYTYTLLTAANPLTTSFTTYTYNLPPDFTATLSYQPYDLILTLMRYNTDFGAFARTPNELAVAQALNASVSAASGDLVGKMNTLYTMSSGQAGVLEQMGGVIYTELPNLAVEDGQFTTRLLLDRLDSRSPGGALPGTAWGYNPGPWADAAQSDAGADLKPRGTNGYWIQQTDSFGTVAATSAAAAFRQSNYGFLGGYEGKGGEGLLLGFAAGYGHANFTSQGSDGTAGVDGYQGDLYGQYTLDGFEVGLVLGYGYNQYQVTRPIGGGLSAAGAYDGTVLGAGLQVVGHLNMEGLNPEALAGVEYAYTFTPSFTENNAQSFDLSVPANNTYSLRPYLGLGIDPRVKAGDLKLEPELRVTLGWEAVSPNSQQTVSLSGAPQNPFTIINPVSGSTLVGAQAGLGLWLDSHAKLFALYDGFFSGSLSLSTVTGGFNLAL